MAKGPTTSRANPDEHNLADEIDAGGGDVDLNLEDAREDGGTRTPRREDDDGERGERKPSDLKYEEDPRDALYSKIGRQRAEQGQELSTEEEDDEAEELAEDEDGDPEVVIVAGPGAREVNRPQEEKPAPRKVTDLQDDDIVIVKVDGADVEMRYGDMKSRAQMHVAADSRLDSAKALLTEVRDLIKNTRPATAPEQRPAGSERREAPPATTDAKTQADRKARLAAIVDTLQTDTPDKAVEALESLIGELRPEGNTSPSVDVQAVVRQTISEEESDRYARVEIGSSYKAVADTFGDVLSDPRLASMAFDDTVGTVVKTLRDAGTPESDFQALADDIARRNAKEPDVSKHDSFGLAILREYAKVQRDPQYKLKPVKDLFEEGLKTTRKWRTGDENVPVNDKGKALTAAAPPRPGNGNGNRGTGAATPSPRVVISSSRTERKAGVSVQPRSASMRTDFSATGPAVRKDTSKTIAQMAADRR